MHTLNKVKKGGRRKGSLKGLVRNPYWTFNGPALDPSGHCSARVTQVVSHLRSSMTIRAFELSCCAADAAAWATLDGTASGQNRGWSLYWAGREYHRCG